jgi:chlorite dismutase
MSVSDHDAPAVDAGLPAVPLTLEGAAVLHQVVSFRWAAWRKLSGAERNEILQEAVAVLAPPESAGESAVYSVLGHKGDLLLVHFRDSFPELNAIQLALNRLRLQEYLCPTASYVSVVELGLYDSTVKLYRTLRERGVTVHSEEWNQEVEQLLERQRTAMRPRLFPKVPQACFLCFYPMDRKRGEAKNWYTLPIDERKRQMEEHGAVGRRYAGKVQQIISGSIGFDDWEWGVDLFGNDPVVFKKLITEMRYDEVSGVYSNFGTFYFGVRCQVANLRALLVGTPPECDHQEAANKTK